MHPFAMPQWVIDRVLERRGRLHAQDPGSAGKSWGRYLVRRLAGYTAKAVPVTGKKIIRAEPVAAQARVGNILILKDRDVSSDK